MKELRLTITPACSGRYRWLVHLRWGLCAALTWVVFRAIDLMLIIANDVDVEVDKRRYGRWEE